MGDPRSLKLFKKMFPVYQGVPDSEFKYHHGHWVISIDGLRMVACREKRSDLLSFANRVEGKLADEK